MTWHPLELIAVIGCVVWFALAISRVVISALNWPSDQAEWRD